MNEFDSAFQVSISVTCGLLSRSHCSIPVLSSAPSRWPRCAATTEVSCCSASCGPLQRRPPRRVCPASSPVPRWRATRRWSAYAAAGPGRPRRRGCARRVEDLVLDLEALLGRVVDRRGHHGQRLELVVGGRRGGARARSRRGRGAPRRAARSTTAAVDLGEVLARLIPPPCARSRAPARRPRARPTSQHEMPTEVRPDRGAPRLEVTRAWCCRGRGGGGRGARRRRTRPRGGCRARWSRIAGATGYAVDQRRGTARPARRPSRGASEPSARVSVSSVHPRGVVRGVPRCASPPRLGRRRGRRG